MTTEARAFLRVCLFVCSMLFAAACQSSAPAESGPPVARSDWMIAPSFQRGIPDGKKLHVVCEDAAKSGASAQLTSAFSAALASKGYESVGRAEDANYVCVLVVRYFGRTSPPQGYDKLLEAVNDTIQGGDEGWLAPDGSGFDTKTRKPRPIRFRARTRNKFMEFFRGKEADEWAIVIDVAIGARSLDKPQMVQRLEGRAWGWTSSLELARPAAIEGLAGEMQKRFAEALP